MRPYLLAVLRSGLAVFLLLATGAILFTTRQNIRSAETLSDLALESTALALAYSAENAFSRAYGGRSLEDIQEVFSDRVVAYATIISRDGEILFHTNPRMIGGRFPEGELDRRWPAGRFESRRIVLGTGVPAYEFDYPMRVRERRTVLLSLVLNTTPMDTIVRDARRMWWTVGVVLCLLWLTGIVSERIVTRQVRLQGELQRRDQLAWIGRMTAVLAHEIRNALGSMKGYAQWVDEKLDAADPKKEGIRVVLEGADRIESLVDDLLLYSREETYRIGPLEPVERVRHALRSVPPAWRGHVDLDLRHVGRALGDRDKLDRVLANGLRNAVQSMGDEGLMEVSVRDDGRWVVIEIRDSGPGIPAEEIPRLFTPFHTTKVDGTGLGLAYSRKVVEGMAGTVELVNRDPGPGAVLTIRLPKTGGK